MPQPTRILHYIHDPMCSWCWAFRPVWAAIRAQLPDDVRTNQLLGGLAPDTPDQMPHEMRRKIREIWRTIERNVPGTRFNFDFWDLCIPRRATLPACRAVIAARQQGVQFEERMILALQTAYYLQARNPSDESTLVSIAGETGLDPARFAADLGSEPTDRQLQQEIASARRMAVDGFPSLVLEEGAGLRPLRIDYRDPNVVLQQLGGRI